MATSYVVDGATLKCSKGGTCKLKVTPGRNTFIQGKPQANVNDYTTKSIPKFNFCSIPKHHQCRLSLQGPWKSGKNDVIIEGAPALMHKSKIKCAKGGVISIQKHNQCLESDGALVFPVKEPKIEVIEQNNNEKVKGNFIPIKYCIDYIPYKEEKGSRRPKIFMEPEYLTIHSTANLNSTAKDERAWLTNPKNKICASFHIVVDQNEAIEVIPLNEVAWHAGDGRNGLGNQKSIGIEIAESGDRGKTLNNAILLVAYMLKERKWGIGKLRRHKDWSGKNCPRILIDKTCRKSPEHTWEWFIKEVQSKLS